MKKLKFLVILLGMMSCSLTSFAYDFEVDGIYYNILSQDDLTCEVAKSPDYSYGGSVVIPSQVVYEGQVFNVTSIGYEAFYRCFGLTSITIPNSVTSIGNEAFSDCSELTSITIPNSVTSIEGFAFFGCSGLTSITIPNSVTSIGESAFNYCNNLEEIIVEEGSPIYDSRDNCNCIIETAENKIIQGCNNSYIPNSVTSIGESAFNGSGISKITIPNSVTSIERFAFDNCNNLPVENDIRYADCIAIKAIDKSKTTYSIKAGTRFIHSYAFAHCTNLTNITIPNSVTNIGNGAFYGCSELTSIIIPNSVSSIGLAILQDCEKIAEITVADGNTTYDSRDNCNCIIETSQNELIQGCKNSIIPESVTSIGIGAFCYCHFTGITHFNIPSSITSIGQQAFWFCSGLNKIIIPSSVTNIGNWAFQGCSLSKIISLPTTPPSCEGDGFGLENKENCVVIVPAESVEAYKAADDWKKFISIIAPPSVQYNYDEETKTATVIPDEENPYSGDIIIPMTTTHNDKEYTVTSIGYKAFYNCSGLTSVTLPNSITSIGVDAFWECRNLAYINIPSSVKSIGVNAFSECASLTSITIPEGITSIEAYTFQGCENLKSITLPSTVENIGQNAFFWCWRMTSINIPSSVTSIGNSAFEYCSGLTSITIPNSVTSIGDEAFEYCTGLTSIAIPNSVTEIRDGVFEGCSGLTSVTIPNSVTNIGFRAFYECTGLTSITIPNSVTNIGVIAFYYCTGLTSITIPNSVTEIRDGVFEGCTGLTSIAIPNSVTSIGTSAFYGCTGLTSAIIGNSVNSIGGTAFKGCTNLNKIQCQRETPPSCSENSFEDVGKQSCVVYVPVESINTYKTATGWKDFLNIEAYEEPNITSIPTELYVRFHGNWGGVKMNEADDSTPKARHFTYCDYFVNDIQQEGIFINFKNGDKWYCPADGKNTVVQASEKVSEIVELDHEAKGWVIQNQTGYMTVDVYCTDHVMKFVFTDNTLQAMKDVDALYVVGEQTTNWSRESSKCQKLEKKANGVYEGTVEIKRDNTVIDAIRLITRPDNGDDDNHIGSLNVPTRFISGEQKLGTGSTARMYLRKGQQKITVNFNEGTFTVDPVGVAPSYVYAVGTLVDHVWQNENTTYKLDEIEPNVFKGIVKVAKDDDARFSLFFESTTTDWNTGRVGPADQSIKPEQGVVATNRISIGDDRAWRVPQGEWMVTLDIANQTFLFDQIHTQDVVVGEAGYATFVAQYPYNVIPANAEINAAQERGNSIHLEPMSEIPAGEAVLIKAPAGTYTFVEAATAKSDVSNDLVAATVDIEANGTQYILAKKNNKVGFFRATSGFIKAGKAYISTTSGINALYFGDDETGINNVNDNDNDNVNDNDNQVIYNLAGQRMAKMQRGINIVNGKKVLIK